MREQKRQQRQRKRKVTLIVWMEFTLLSTVAAFCLGKWMGHREAMETRMWIPDSGTNPVYEADNPLNQDVVQGELEAGEDSWKDIPELLLVNKDNQLPQDYKPVLKTLPDGVNKAEDLAYKPLCDMLAAGRKAGLSFEICSSYRSVERQQELLDEDIDDLMARGYSYKQAYAEVTRETMPPGFSEHATGLSFDIVSLGYQMLDSGQKKTEENKWLRKNCADYGFILRYPEDKEDITGISYESWHFRYVGKDIAKYITENGITLEEYLEEKDNGKGV